MDKFIPKFKGIKAYEEELMTNSAEEPTVETEGQVRPLKRKSLEIDIKLKVESNEKRLKSLKLRLDLDKRQQTLVKEAINSDKRLNKRIVFDNDFDDSFDPKVKDFSNEGKVKSIDSSDDKSFLKQKKLLFDSDSDDDNNEDFDETEDQNKLKDFDLDFNKKINDKNAEKLIELNSRFAHDSRFRIDERFLDQIEDNEEVIDEKEKNLHLLEEVLGKKLKPIVKSNDKSDRKSHKIPKNELFISRFDPKSEKSAKYEVNTTSEKKSAKKVSFDQKILDKEEEKNRIESEVSKEVYYEVSSSLKDSLSQKEEEFSLTQLFGTSSAQTEGKISSEHKNVEPFHQKLEKSRKIGVSTNPFKYDSSGSDEDEDEEEEGDEQQKELMVKTKSDSNKSKPVLNGFKFFFDKNDSRFKEDVFWDKDLVQKAKNGWKERQIMIIRSMSVRKRSAKKNKKSDQKFFKYKNNQNFKRFPKRDNKFENTVQNESEV